MKHFENIVHLYEGIADVNTVPSASWRPVEESCDALSASEKSVGICS